MASLVPNPFFAVDDDLPARINQVAINLVKIVPFLDDSQKLPLAESGVFCHAHSDDQGAGAVGGNPLMHTLLHGLDRRGGGCFECTYGATTDQWMDRKSLYPTAR